MANKKLSSIMVVLVTLSIFAATINIQAAIAQEQTPLPTDEIPQKFCLEGGAILEIYGAEVPLRVYDRITYNYPPLPPPEEPRSDIEGVALTAVSLSQPTPAVEPAWDIRVRGGVFCHAIVGLPGEGLTEMWQIDLIRGDVNADGEVNCRDIRIIKRALWSSRRSRSRWKRARWNPACDLNRDGRVTLRDLRIAFYNYGKSAEWQPLEIVEVTDTMIFGKTDHFSIFRGR